MVELLLLLLWASEGMVHTRWASSTLLLSRKKNNPISWKWRLEKIQSRHKRTARQISVLNGALKFGKNGRAREIL